MDDVDKSRARGPFHWRPSRQHAAEPGADSPPPRPSWTLYTVGIYGPQGGGWSYVALEGSMAHEGSGREGDTTHQRMELQAAVRGLGITPPEAIVRLVTRDRAIPHGMTTQLERWQRRGWVTAAGQPVEHRDLWESLAALAAERDVTWEWMRDATAVPGASTYVRRALLLAQQSMHHVEPAPPSVPIEEAAATAVVSATGPDPSHALEVEKHPHIEADDEHLKMAPDARPYVADDQPRPSRLAPSPIMAEPATTWHKEIWMDTKTIPVAETGMADGADTREALVNECQTLERQWMDLQEQLLRLDDEWKRLMERATAGLSAVHDGRAVGWADSTLLFSDLDRYARRLASLTREGREVCSRYAATLQRVVEAS